MHLLIFIVSKTFSVYRYAAFPVATLFNLSLSVRLNGFIISNRRFITPCQRATAKHLRFSFGAAYLTTTI